MKKGFSLMELIISIVIIGIMSAAIIGMNSAKDTAKITAVYSQINDIKKLVDNYMKSNNLFQLNVTTNKIEQYTNRSLPKNPWGYKWNVSSNIDNSGKNELSIYSQTGTQLNKIPGINGLEKRINSNIGTLDKSDPSKIMVKINYN